MAQGICATNFVKIGPAVPGICCGQTHTQTDRNTPLCYRGGVINTETIAPRNTVTSTTNTVLFKLLILFSVIVIVTVNKKYFSYIYI